MSPSPFPDVDLALARRLERAEAMANAACVESRRNRQPEVGADWIDVAGVYAMFDGPWLFLRVRPEYIMATDWRTTSLSFSEPPCGLYAVQYPPTLRCSHS